MKNRAFYDPFVDVFLDGQIHGRGAQVVDVELRRRSGFERKEDSPEHIQRWEDDGGPAADVEESVATDVVTNQVRSAQEGNPASGSQNASWTHLNALRGDEI